MTDIFMFGLNSDPATNVSWDTIDFAWHFSGQGGFWYIYESGAVIGGAQFTATLAERPSVEYNKRAIQYRKSDGTLVREVPVAAGLTFWFDSSIYASGSRISNISWVNAGAAGNPGAQGNPGAAGNPGAQGNPGASAYQIAVAAGFVGTEAQWLASLQGVAGVGTDYVYGDSGAAVLVSGASSSWKTSVRYTSTTASDTLVLQLQYSVDNGLSWTAFGTSPGISYGFGENIARTLTASFGNSSGFDRSYLVRAVDTGGSGSFDFSRSLFKRVS